MSLLLSKWLTPSLVLQAVMVNQPSLQSQLLKELVSYNDLSLAAKCAQDYSIPFSSLPSNLQIHIASSALSSTSITGHDKTQSCQKSKLEADSSTRKLGKQRLPNSTRLVVSISAVVVLDHAVFTVGSAIISLSCLTNALFMSMT